MRDDDMTFDQFGVWSQVQLVIWGSKTKTDYLVLDVKLLLINMNYVEFFFF